MLKGIGGNRREEKDSWYRGGYRMPDGECRRGFERWFSGVIFFILFLVFFLPAIQ